MPHQTVYFTEKEQRAVEQAAKELDESFSQVVRDAVGELVDGDWDE